MKKFSVRCALLILSSMTSTYFAKAHPIFPVRETTIDSVGVEKKNGKRFILHRVDEGQTLFAIARKYHRSVADIKAANPDIKESVKYSQVVRIPMPDGTTKPKETKPVDKTILKQEKVEKQDTGQKADTKSVTTAKPKKSLEKESKKAEDPARAGIHVVESGQTLYSLASRYGVSQEDLRKWNSLPGNNVLIGQALIVSEKAHQARVPSTSMAKIAAKTSGKVPEPASKNVVVHSTESRPSESRPSESRPTTPVPEPHPTEPKVTPPSSEQKPERRSDVAHNESDAATKPTSSSASTKPAEIEIESPRPGNDAPMPTHGRRISDSGIAEMIEGADGSGKYLALHRTAPIGTLVQVRNAFNNQSLWVKVIGRLPNTGINDKILIKLSTQAFSKLSPEDRRFRAEVSYIVR